MKKCTGIFVVGLLLMTLFTGCHSGAASGEITVISREEGSGTRAAFVELFGVEEKTDAGEKRDSTVETAEITNNTAVMMTSVMFDQNAVGYISLGSLNNTVKALKIDGVMPTAENVKNGSYGISRPFLVATGENPSEITVDFLSFICSGQGQEIVEKAGYTALGRQPDYSGTAVSGRVVVAGSSSVAPVMEQLREAYLLRNPNAEIEVQQNDSTTGINAVAEGLCDIGMASRALKASEKEKGITGTEIARDGIVVIVNPGNPAGDLTREQVRKIYTGYALYWQDVASQEENS